jgi:hypothetical protein
VPVVASLTIPSADITPALRKALIRARTRLAAIRNRTRSNTAECASSSKEAPTHYPHRGPCRDVAGACGGGCTALAATARALSMWRRWRSDDLGGGGHAAASPAGGALAAGAGPDAAAWAAGVVAGVARWQQVADPGGLDRPGPGRRQHRHRRRRGRGDAGLAGGLAGRVRGGGRSGRAQTASTGTGCREVTVQGGRPCSLSSPV